MPFPDSTPAPATLRGNPARPGRCRSVRPRSFRDRRLRGAVVAHCAGWKGAESSMPLILLGAPLGNPGDASTRLREVLTSADIVAAEDTRRLARLAQDLGITVGGRVVSYFEGNEERR